MRQALRHNIRESSDRIFEPGDESSYKWLSSDYWEGPAYVLGEDNHQVILKYGGQFVRT